jgi:periplasmic protein TonB
MTSNEIQDATILDIIFEKRNKDYGAYELRRNYNRRMRIALFITIPSFVLLNLFFVTKYNDSIHQPTKNDSVIIRSYDEKKFNEPSPPPDKIELPLQLEKIKSTFIQIVKDDQVRAEDMPPEVHKLQQAIIDVVNKDGKNFDISSSIIDDNKAFIIAPENRNYDDPIFTKVEIEASFKGGDAAWRSYLIRHLKASVPVDNGAKPGQYTVIVQFIVDKEGNISDVLSLTSHGYGMEEEAIRVISKGPNWEPAIQNGHKVKAYRKQLITFVVSVE